MRKGGPADVLALNAFPKAAKGNTGLGVLPGERIMVTDPNSIGGGSVSSDVAALKAVALGPHRPTLGGVREAARLENA